MNILIVDDETGLRKGLGKILRLHGFEIFEASSCIRAREIIKTQEIHIVLLDLKMGKENGYSLLKELREEEPFLSVVIITGYGNIESAVECMKAGATNYFTKPIDTNLLLQLLEKERETIQMRVDNAGFRKGFEEISRKIVLESSHPGMRKIKEIIEKVKDSPATVLLFGETGTGKEIIARRIHYSSIYRDRPFLGINCASINDNLLESELFGHERGAFTGAIERKLGRFELAGKGTLFLDEIGDMSLAMQSKLLRVLEERNFERVGGIKPLRVNCRIMAATNKDLKELIRRTEFREELYYRLNVVTIELPPLRERRDDIPQFCKLFIEEANRLYNRRIKRINPELMRWIIDYHWPGNIRELKNVIYNAVLLSEGEEIRSLNINGSDRQNSRDYPELVTLNGNLKNTVQEYAKRAEISLIKKTLEKQQGNVSRTASELGISRKTLYKKIREYSL
ncbi:MAG: sigma-54-dependent Fis family transcriptional regulator [Spirochaetes bacterium]|nr:MAG: sigma-54-dependent Fis family transcriptional regulator [Spirochaetota bacterium]